MDFQGFGVVRSTHSHANRVQARIEPQGSDGAKRRWKGSRRGRPWPFLLPFALTACTVGPHYTPPAPPQVAAWHHQVGSAVSQGTNPDPRWWTSFGDQTLTRLISMAIAGNLDLKQAVLRVVEARQTVITARAAGLPMLNGQASYMREQLGARGILESQGIYGQLNSLANQAQTLNQYSPGIGNEVRSGLNNALDQVTSPIDLFQYGLDASWELDLFGRVRRSVEQARATEQAQAEANNDSLVMLEAEIGQAYAQLRGAQALAASQAENIRADQAALDLTARRQRAGLTTALDVDQAQTQLATDEQQLPTYEKQAQQAIDQLNVLVGSPPGTIDAMLNASAPLPSPPGIVDIGLPSTLARRRPDIREAEAQLHAATASVGVAVASFYPDVSLTGSLGLRAIDASYLTRWASHFYSAGPSVSLPIFQGGRLTSSLRLARAQQAGAALSYRGTVLNALREVEDGLVAYRTDRAARDKLTETTAAAADSLYLARNQYEHGLNSFIQVLDSERTLVNTRQQLVQANVTLTNDVVTLYRALGGGWQYDGASVATPAAAPPPLPGALDSVAGQ